MWDSRVGVAGGTSVSGLIVEDQYLQLSTQLTPSAAGGELYVYGLPEHVGPLALQYKGDAGHIYTLMARDQGTPLHRHRGNTNLYSAIPFYLVLDPVTGEGPCSHGRPHRRASHPQLCFTLLPAR